jgi:hypothetical protein
MKKVIKSLYDYLKDWKNLLNHALVGVLLLVVAIYLPVSIYIRILILVLVIIFNIWRNKKK